MTQIDFYVLKQVHWQDRLDFSVRLTEKAVQAPMPVCLLIEDSEQTSHLQDLLWRRTPESFLSHSDPPHPKDTVRVLNRLPPGLSTDLVINLMPQIPDHFSDCARLAEVVIQDEKILQTTRKLYSQYKSLGYIIRMHNL